MIEIKESSSIIDTKQEEWNLEKMVKIYNDRAKYLGGFSFVPDNSVKFFEERDRI